MGVQLVVLMVEMKVDWMAYMSVYKKDKWWVERTVLKMVAYSVVELVY